MNPIHEKPMARKRDRDASYHYLYGRHQLYRYLSGSEQFQSYPTPTRPHEFSRQSISGLADQGPQTVEQLILQGYFAVPRGQPETSLLTDKQTTAWLGLDDVIRQVQQRVDIYEQNIYEIKLAECSAINDLFAWEAKYGWPAPTKEQYVLGKRLQALYAEQRAERVSAWRDLSRIRQTLPEHAQQYLSTLRKIQILEDGDVP